MHFFLFFLLQLFLHISCILIFFFFFFFKKKKKKDFAFHSNCLFRCCCPSHSSQWRACPFFPRQHVQRHRLWHWPILDDQFVHFVCSHSLWLASGAWSNSSSRTAINAEHFLCLWTGFSLVCTVDEHGHCRHKLWRFHCAVQSWNLGLVTRCAIGALHRRNWSLLWHVVDIVSLENSCKWICTCSKYILYLI